mgnify:CR=1 FL=1
MSTTTTNYGFIKPELTDAADITAMNSNWDKIDEELGKVSTNVGGRSTMVEYTLLANTWQFSGVSNYYVWNNSNIVSASQIIELVPSQSITAEQLEALQAANIIGTEQSIGRVTLTAYGDVPTIDIPVIFIIRGDA